MVSISKTLAMCFASVLVVTTQAVTTTPAVAPVIMTETPPAPVSTTASPAPTPAATTKSPPAPTPAATTKSPVPTPATTTKPPPTPAPTTKTPPPATPAPTTKAPQTLASTTKPPPTPAVTTKAPTPTPTAAKPAPTTPAPTTPAPTTPAPTTPAPTPPPQPTEPVFNLGSPTFFGSGCPADSLQVVPSADGQTVSILFSEFVAQTTPTVSRDRRSCNLAVPVTLQPGISIGVYRVDYRGYSYVPAVKDAYADLQVSYFFAGATGPTFKRTWPSGSDEPVEITNKVGVSGVVWTPCGSAATTFRVNAAITAFKPVADRKDQVQIEVDTTDVTVDQGMRFFLTNRTCT